MHPILLEFGSVTIYSYGVFVSLGFIVAMAVGIRNARALGLEPRHFRDAALVAMIAAVVGSRAVYVAIEYRYFLEEPLRIFELWRGGLVYYGGLIAAVAITSLYFKATGTDALRSLDAAAPALALGQALGRLGCFFTGCCFGTECELPWAVTFTNPRGLARLGAPLHPVQLYEAIICLMLFVFLTSYLKQGQLRSGRVFASYLIIYPLMRLILEFYRGDPRGQIGPLSTAQAFSLPLMAVGLFMWLGPIFKKRVEA